MVMRADKYHYANVGSPAPITFGMGKDPSQSMALSPGAGSLGTFGSTNFGGGFGGGSAPNAIP